MGRCCDSWGERYFYHMSFAVFFWCVDMFGIFVSMVPLLFSAQTAFLDILKTSISSHRNRFIEPRIGQEPHWNSNTSCATDTSERFSLSIWGESTSGKWTGTASCCFKSLIWCLDEFWYHFLVQSSEEFLQPTKISPVTEIWNNVCCEWYPSLVFFFFFWTLWLELLGCWPRILNSSSNCSRKWENYSTPFRKIRETDHVPVKAPSCLQSDPVWSVG